MVKSLWVRVGPAVTLALLALGPGLEAAHAAGEGVSVAGFAFVDSSVTSQGSHAALPDGTKIIPSGATVTGEEGCPTTPYRTDGLLVVVMDYAGRPTAGSVTISQDRDGFVVNRAPYYLDFNPGRVLQFLGPVFENGTYDLKIEYDFAQGAPKQAHAVITLARQC